MICLFESFLQKGRHFINLATFVEIFLRTSITFLVFSSFFVFLWWLVEWVSSLVFRKFKLVNLGVFNLPFIKTFHRVLGFSEKMLGICFILHVWFSEVWNFWLYFLLFFLHIREFLGILSFHIFLKTTIVDFFRILQNSLTHLFAFYHHWCPPRNGLLCDLCMRQSYAFSANTLRRRRNFTRFFAIILGILFLEIDWVCLHLSRVHIYFFGSNAYGFDKRSEHRFLVFCRQILHFWLYLNPNLIILEVVIDINGLFFLLIHLH